MAKLETVIVNGTKQSDDKNCIPINKAIIFYNKYSDDVIIYKHRTYTFLYLPYKYDNFIIDF